MKPSSTNDCMAIIENIYFSIDFNTKIGNFNTYIKTILPKLVYDSQVFLKTREEVTLFDGVSICAGIKMYPFGFKREDKFRIFIAQNTGSNYGVYVIINAVFLHLNNVFVCLNEVQAVLEQILKHYDKDFEYDEIRFKLSRVDICNHNNFINLDTYIKSDEYNSRTVQRFKSLKNHITLNGENDQEINYYRYGSGDICVRFYNKVKEICEQQYKPFFFQRWLDYGLIDKRTYNIYVDCFKLNNDYRIDFIYANLKANYEDIDVNTQAQINMIYYSNDKKLIKYDELMMYVKKFKIKFVSEIVNVEYECHTNFLKALRLKNDNDEDIDYTDIFDLLLNFNTIYKYLTDKEFRVINPKSGYARKREKEVDDLWKVIQQSKILNILDLNLSKHEIKLYHDYNKKMCEFKTCKDVLKKAVHLSYISSNKFNYELINNYSIEQLLDNVYNISAMNENYLNIRDMAVKQIKYYGVKEG